MSKVLSAEDQLMILTYYYMKKHNDCKSVSEARRIIDDGKFIEAHIGEDTDEKVDVTNRDVFVLRGLRTNGRKAKSCAKILFEQKDDGFEMQVDKNNSLTEVRMSTNYIEHILKGIEATDSSKIELNDITSEINGKTVIIPVEKQKEFFEELLGLLKSRMKETTIRGRRGSVDRNVAEKIDVKTTIIQNFNTISSSEIVQNLNDNSAINRIQKKIDELKSKIVTDSTLTEDNINMIKEQISKLEEKIEALKHGMDEFETKITEMIDESSTTNDAKVLNDLIAFYNTIVVDCNEHINKIKNDSTIFDDDKKERIEQLNLIINNCQKRISIIRKKINNIEKDLRPIHNEYNTYNSYVQNTPSKTESKKEEKTETKTDNPEEEKRLTLCLNYKDLGLGDKFRAKIEAYTAANGKKPNLFQKLRLLLPSRKYSELANTGIDGGSIDLNKVIKNMDKYSRFMAYEKNGKLYSLRNGLEMYKVDTTPKPTSSKTNEEHKEEREER